MAQILTEAKKAKNLMKRIRKTGKISNDDAEYIRKHYQHFQIPMFIRKKREKELKKMSEKELDHIIEHYQDYRIPMFKKKVQK